MTSYKVLRTIQFPFMGDQPLKSHKTQYLQFLEQLAVKKSHQVSKSKTQKNFNFENDIFLEQFQVKPSRMSFKPKRENTKLKMLNKSMRSRSTLHDIPFEFQIRKWSFKTTDNFTFAN
ncbi:hypothetical protein pb186bvf_010376 [Paramecium bursaria]